jgi:hypothetical protein
MTIASRTSEVFTGKSNQIYKLNDPIQIVEERVFAEKLESEISVSVKYCRFEARLIPTTVFSLHPSALPAAIARVCIMDLCSIQ